VILAEFLLSHIELIEDLIIGVLLTKNLKNLKLDNRFIIYSNNSIGGKTKNLQNSIQKMKVKNNLNTYR